MMECICESCARKDCKERTKQDDLRIVIACEEYLKHKATNADRIRAMTDEDLAIFFGAYFDCSACPIDGSCIQGKSCKELLLEWLQQPVKEEANGPDEV